MSRHPLLRALPLALLALALALPYLASAYRTQLSFLWVMIVFALTWDVLGGQTGYNSFGNVVFVGVGMYACAVTQRDFELGYFPELFLGLAATTSPSPPSAWASPPASSPAAGTTSAPAREW